MLIALAIRNLLRRRLRTAVTIAVMALAGAGLVFTNGFFEGLYRALEHFFVSANTGHLQIMPETRPGSGDEPEAFIRDINGLTKALLSITDIRSVAPVLEGAGVISDGEQNHPVVLRGIDAAKLKSTLMTTYHSRGRWFSFKDAGLLIADGGPLEPGDDVGVLAGQEIAGDLGLKTGDRRIVLTRTVDESLSGADVIVRGIFSSGSVEVDATTIIVPIKTLQTLLRTDGVHSIRVDLAEGAQMNAVRIKIEAVLRGFEQPLVVKDWKELNDFYEKTRALFSRWAHVVVVVLVMIVLLSVNNIMNMSVSERIDEIGTLRAMGATRGRIVATFLCEGILLGFAGGIAGALAGGAATWITGLTGIAMPSSPAISLTWYARPEILWSTVSTSFFLTVAAAAASSLPPSVRASRIQIATALRSLG